MKNKHHYRECRIDLFPQKQNDDTWLCRANLDGEWLAWDEFGAEKANVQKKVLDAIKRHIDIQKALKISSS